MSGPDDLAAKAAALEGVVLRAAEGESPGGDGVGAGAEGAGGFGFDFDIDPLELTADSLETLFEFLAPYWLDDEIPDHIRITRAKIEKLSRPYMALGMKYLPVIFEKFPLEAMALFQTAMIVKPLLRHGVPTRKPKPVNDAGQPAAG